MHAILIPTEETDGTHPFQSEVDMTSADQVRAYIRGVDEITGTLGPRIYLPVTVVDAGSGSVLLGLSDIELQDTNYRVSIEIVDSHGAVVVYESLVSKIGIVAGSTGGGVAWSGVVRDAVLTTAAITVVSTGALIASGDLYLVSWPEALDPSANWDLVIEPVTYRSDYGAVAGVVSLSSVVGVVFSVTAESAGSAKITLANYGTNTQEDIVVAPGGSYTFEAAEDETIVLIQGIGTPAPGDPFSYVLTAA